ncbi:HD domain-containing protein [Miltoncostaea oceani]|uniref:HD domain-containing protein n=1 Tax=Miltoncostaea oceani TaxID=2843216 RepID=UPI001FE60278|nr:HD domain-containing protein [Miltoncostaea oceani]
MARGLSERQGAGAPAVTDLPASERARLAEARAFAIAAHADQRYGDGRPYRHHLDAVEAVLVRFGFGADLELRMSAQLHDVIEDTPITFDEVRETFGPEVARLVDAVTNRQGPNRKTRHALTYPRIRAAGERAVIVKLADRIANLEAGGTLLGMYRKEQDGFRHALKRPGELRAMWARIEELLR